MANRFLGELAAEHDGTAYTLRFDFNAMCDFEAATGKNAMQAIAEFEGGSIGFTEMRALIYSALVQDHPDADVKLAGKILSADMDVLSRLITAAFPEVKASADKAPASGNRKAGKAAA